MKPAHLKNGLGPRIQAGFAVEPEGDAFVAEADAAVFVRAVCVGERGENLSGVQAQRLALARAFLKDAPLLLMDEATAALDTQTEAQVSDAIAHLARGRTVLVIAHRLRTVRHAARILVMDSGCVVEHGTHDDLLRAGGRYAQMVRTDPNHPVTFGATPP